MPVLVPTLLGSTQLPKWKSGLIVGVLTALLFGWFALFAVSEPDSVQHDVVRVAPVLLSVPIGLWMIWRGTRGLMRASHLRQSGVEVDAEFLAMRSRTHRHEHEANIGIQKKVSTETTQYVDYAIHLDAKSIIVRDVPVILGAGVPLGRSPGTVHIQVDPADLGNSRLMTTPSHVTYLIRAAQLLAGCMLAVAVPAAFAGGLF